MFQPPSPTAGPSAVVWPTFLSAQDIQDQFRTFVDRTEHVLGHTKATRMWYRNGFDSFCNFLKQTGAPWPLAVTPDVLESWLGWNRDRNMSPVSLKTYWTALKAFVRSVVDRTGSANPFLLAHTPRLPQHNYKALPPADCERILVTVRNYPWKTPFEATRNAAILATALYAGLRKRELIRLEYRDVDLHEGTIQIRKGKGRNGGKDRTAYIPAELRELLAHYLRERWLHKVTAPEFFTSLHTGRGITAAALPELVKRIKDASGVPFSLHVLRHSFVTMLLRSGVPIHIARDLAGHASIQSTEGYAKVFREDLKQHIQAVRYLSAR
jgi:site-specific recombinase XerD